MMDSTSGLDPDLDRWLHRLPLAERLEIQRREEQQQGWRFTRSTLYALCSCCGVRLKPGDVADPYKRCGYCRRKRRLEKRRARLQPRRRGPE